MSSDESPYQPPVSDETKERPTAETFSALIYVGIGAFFGVLIAPDQTNINASGLIAIFPGAIVGGILWRALNYSSGIGTQKIFTGTALLFFGLTTVIATGSFLMGQPVAGAAFIALIVSAALWLGLVVARWKPRG